MDSLNKKVPPQIGICVDGFGFPGILDLRTIRKKYAKNEFFGVIKDRAMPAYIADFHDNENSEKNPYLLKEVESIHPAGVYYVSDTNSMNNINKLESYVLFLDRENYCYIETRKSATCIPEIRTGNKKWKHYYEVVKPAH